jgi:AbrB family looped-hinge helix DNA binding protein
MAKRSTIDSAGRLVIPKPIRERHGLYPGTDVDFLSQGGRIVIEPATQQATLIEREGLLIVTSELAGGPADQQSVREERLNRLAGNES